MADGNDFHGRISIGYASPLGNDQRECTMIKKESPISFGEVIQNSMGLWIEDISKIWVKMAHPLDVVPPAGILETYPCEDMPHEM